MPSTPEPPAHITVKVKVPPGYLSTADDASGTDSFLLGSDVPVTSNVGTLRRQIQQLIPTHPAPERQRLLYGGRALVDNEQKLGDAFNVKRDPTQTEYVVHLLVKGEQSAGDSGPAHRRAVSTPPVQTPPGQQQQQQPQTPFQQGIHGQRAPYPLPGGQFFPHQQPFPQIIARNQQMRAGMGMQGIGGQQVQGQSQAHANGQPEQTSGAGRPPQHQHNQEVQAPAHVANNGQPEQGAQHPHVPGRPISGQGFHVQGVGPNGQRFQIHQQMMQFPLQGGMAGQMPFGFPGMPQMPPIPGMGFPQPHLGQGLGAPQQSNGPSALDRARENMAEMRRVLDELRNQSNTSEEQQRWIGEVQQRAQSLSEYIDPLQLRNANENASPNASGQRSTPANPTAPPTNRTSLPAPFQQGLPPLYNAPRRPTAPMPPPAQHHIQRPSNPNELTAYLLSSPQGPQALLFSPQHGAYTGSFAQNIRPQPTPTTDPNRQDHQQQAPALDPVAQAAHRAAQEMQVQHAQLHQAQANQQAQAGQEPLEPIQALLAHFWLLIRIMIFAWFLLGSNMGWQRPLLLLAIGMGFWIVRAGALGDGGPVRRWWEGVVGVEPARRPQADGQQGPGQAGQQQQQNDGQQQPPVAGQQQPRHAMPTPEQVAQRLLNEQADRNQQQHAWWRERIRPIERAVALFVASLWPGVGEATVRATREMEERQRAEEEETARAEGERSPEEGLSGENDSGKGDSSAVATEDRGVSEGLRERKAASEATKTEGEGQALDAPTGS